MRRLVQKRHNSQRQQNIAPKWLGIVSCLGGKTKRERWGGCSEMEQGCNDNKTGETEALRDKAIPEPICASQIPHILTWY